MESLNLPTTAAQAKAFVAPSSLSYPMLPNDQTSDLSTPGNTNNITRTNGASELKETNTGGVSGIVPTLQ